MPIKNSTILTEKLQDKLCEYVKKGLPKEKACYLCGIGEKTLYEWIEKGVGNDAQEPFRSLAQAIKTAEAQFALSIIDRTEQEQNPKMWSKWVTLGERLQPATFGKMERIEVSGNPDQPIPVTFTGMEKST